MTCPSLAFINDAVAAESEEKVNTNDQKRKDIENFVAQKMVKKSSSSIGNDNEGFIGEYYTKTNDLAKEFNAALEATGCDCTGIDTKSLRALLGKHYSWANHAESCMTDKDCTADPQLKDKAISLGIELDNTRSQYQYLVSIKDAKGELYAYQYKDAEGNIHEIPFIVNNEDATIKTIAGVTRGCVPLPFKLYEMKSCLFCPLFDVIYTAVQSASTASYNKIGRPLGNLAAIGLAIWIAFMVLKNVSALTVQKAPEFLNNLFQASLKVFIVYFMLVNSSIVYNIIVGPLLKAGFEFGVSFLDHNKNALTGCTASLKTIKGGGGVLPQYVYANLSCFIQAIQNELAVPQAIGSSLMCISRNAAKTNISVIANVMPDFSMMLQGAIIYVIAWILSIAFGFYLIDATVSLGIFGMMLPFIILCWPFKLTHGYFEKGISVFMNSFFVYVFMGLVTSISIELIGQGLTGGEGGFDAVEAAINGNEVKTLQSLLDIGFSGFLILLACCIFGVKLMMQVEQLADKFSGGLSLGMGAKLGGLAYGAATKGGMATGGLAAGAVKGGASAAWNAPITKSGKSLKDFGKQGANFVKGKAKAAGKATLKGTGHAARFLASPAINLYKAARGRRTPSA